MVADAEGRDVLPDSSLRYLGNLRGRLLHLHGRFGNGTRRF
jgi:hypothetical protein